MRARGDRSGVDPNHLDWNDRERADDVLSDGGGRYRKPNRKAGQQERAPKLPASVHSAVGENLAGYVVAVAYGACSAENALERIDIARTLGLLGSGGQIARNTVRAQTVRVQDDSAERLRAISEALNDWGSPSAQSVRAFQASLTTAARISGMCVTGLPSRAILHIFDQHVMAQVSDRTS